ncbi:MAG: hypothetical protein OXP74_02480 [Acidobacteriota bacterium]|nr:hypothetical protein [Acidobacteriota bacterium]
MDDLLRACERLWPQGISIFLSHQARFRNPLSPADREALSDSDAAADPAVVAIVAEELPERLDRLERGTYFPVPLARAVAGGRGFDDALMSFHYPPVVVDADRRWSWKGQPVAERIRRFFVQHIGFEPALGVWFVEYRVNDGWWDKCYLDCATPPLVAIQLREEDEAAGGGVVADLNNGRTDTLDPDSLRLDERERLFASSADHGLVEIADAPRFALLRTASEDCRTVEFAGARRSLRWPAGDAG